MKKKFSWREVKSSLFHLFFPNRCPFCGKCIPCQSHCCIECKEKQTSKQAVFWTSCDKWEFDLFAAPFLYGYGAENGIYELKFHGNLTPAEHLGYYQYLCLKQGGMDQFDIITAVPMAKCQKRRRGYNQAAELGKVIAYYSNKPYQELLCKKKKIKVQHTLSAEERKRNVIGAFGILNSSVVKGKTILLVDDVMTTGSTMNECAKVLKLAGAREVIATAVCKVKEDKTDLETMLI